VDFSQFPCISRLNSEIITSHLKQILKVEKILMIKKKKKMIMIVILQFINILIIETKEIDIE